MCRRVTRLSVGVDKIKYHYPRLLLAVRRRYGENEKAFAGAVSDGPLIVRETFL